jgi:organic hydroperoxide reductase OsmC/OhrA
MSLINNVLYRAHVKATAGRDERAVSYDGRLAMMRLVARRDGVALPTGTEVEAIVGVGPTRRGFETEVELKTCRAYLGPRPIRWSRNRTRHACTRTRLAATSLFVS